MRRRTWAPALSIGVLLALTGCGDDAPPSEEQTTAGEDAGALDPETDGGGDSDDQGDGAVPGVEGSSADLTAVLHDGDGEEIGTVELTEGGGGTEVSVDVEGLPPGFHGFHVHATGVCEPDSANPDDPSETGDFLSAGGHIGVDDADHGAHVGDLTSLYVTEAGEGTLMTVTDNFVPDDLLDEDGSAVMIHEKADNFANIPERYAEDGPDADTLSTGDAGNRLACAVVEE